MQKKIIIALAPTNGAGPGNGNPVASRTIAEQVIAGAKAGATLAHLHARDENGALTTDLTAFNAAVATIKASCDLILEASTGGLSTLSAAERALPAANPHAQLASLNIGSLNFGDRVYHNSVPEIHYWVKTMAELKVKPGMEIFDTGNLDFALELIGEGAIKPPCSFSFVFDVRWGMSFDPELLAWLVKRLPAGSCWGAIFVGSKGFAKHVEAARQGATFVRTGFEDSREYGGKVAADNPELVTALRLELERSGFSIAAAEEARAMIFN
jgi:3-keto-5-aminohexanoate cleavage enzyme